jgi:hypothetical protein
MLRQRGELQRLTALPAPGFAPQTTSTVAGAILRESEAPTDGVAVAVLQQSIAGTAGTQGDLGSVRRNLALIKKGLYQVAGFPKKGFSPESVATRLSPFFLAHAATHPQVLAVVQQAKANGARAEAEAVRPGEGSFYVAPRSLLLSLS